MDPSLCQSERFGFVVLDVIHSKRDYCQSTRKFGTTCAHNRVRMKQFLDTLLLLQNSTVQNPEASAAGTDELRKKLPGPVLEHSDRLWQRGKKAVTFVRRGVCGQCHMQVAVGLLALLRRQDNLYRCENCGAYLYWQDEPAVLELPPRTVKPGKRGRPRKNLTHVA